MHSFFPSLLALAVLAATAVGGASRERALAEDPGADALVQDAPSAVPMSSLELSVRQLTELQEEEIETWLAEDPGSERLRAVIALVGRSVPPSFPAAWGQRRQAEQATARSYLRKSLDARNSSFDWRDEISKLLNDEDFVVPDELWAAAARVSSEFSLFEMTQELALALDPTEFSMPEGQEAPLVTRGQVRRSVARRALHQLYRQWFEDEASVRPLYASLESFSQNNVFRQTLIDTDRVALDRLRRLVEVRPADAPSRLKDPDPRVKAHAATAIVRAVGETVIDPEDAIDKLLIELRASAHDAGVFHAVLEALIEILASAPPDYEPLRELRGVLGRALASDAPLGVRTSIASGLSRLPWGEPDAEPADGAAAGLRTLAGMVEGLAVWRPLRDDDEIVFVLQSLLSLGSRAGGKDLDVRSTVGFLDDALLTLFQDGELKPDVRSASARALATFVPLVNLGGLLQRLGEAGERKVPRLELIRALQRIGPELAPDSKDARQLTEALLLALGDSESDLRRQALDALRDPKLAKHTRLVPVAEWLRLLESERVPGLSLGLYELVQLSGSPEDDLVRVWESPSFERAATKDARVFARLTALLRDWCAGSVERVAQAKVKLLSIDGEALRPSRVAAILQLIADLEDEAAASLEEDAACELLELAGELRESGLSSLLSISTSENRPFLERLLRAPLLERCTTETPAETSYETLRTIALLSAELWSLDPETLTADQVIERFARAASRVELPSGPLESGAPLESRRPGARLLRERARFFAAAGREAEALSDFTEAFRFEQQFPIAEAPLLSNGDLRRAAELQRNTQQTGSLQVVSVNGEPDSVAATASGIMDVLLARPSWSLEPAEARFRDLSQRLELAAQGGTAVETERFLELLAQLPDLPLTGPRLEGAELPESPEPVALPEALEGLVENYSWLLQFHTWRSRLEDRARQARESETGVQPAGFEPEDSEKAPAPSQKPSSEAKDSKVKNPSEEAFLDDPREKDSPPSETPVDSGGVDG